MRASTALLALLTACLPPPGEERGGPRPLLRAWRGSTPTLDGVLEPGEWDDATEFRGVTGWTSTFAPVADPRDLALEGWVKHDGTHLWFAFRVSDDVLYGIDLPRWLPDENPDAHALSPKGFPWFGDGMEILLNARPTGREPDGVGAAGSGTSWQMVCNLTKSRLGGIGTGGLLEGEPRSSERAWATYAQWIRTGAMSAVARQRSDAKGYVIEWRIAFDPCVELAPRLFWSPSLGEAALGLNLALQDLDEKEKGAGHFGSFHHEEWWSGDPKRRTDLNQWGTLILLPGRRRD